ncbi:MAG: flagellar hook-length control protein FliK [Candidatus Latescibacteria bacterium]|nr:flagellar hook-length control protein FliK [Candidatus Latescibacterota bacterium]
MAAVAPAAPKQPLHGGRSPRPAKGAADFGRFLQEARTEGRPAAEAEPPEKPAAPAPQDRAPDAAPEPPAPTPPADEGSDPAATPDEAETEPKDGAAVAPEPAKDPQQPAVAATANQPIVPLVPVAPTMPAAAPSAELETDAEPVREEQPVTATAANQPIVPLVPVAPAVSAAAAEAAAAATRAAALPAATQVAGANPVATPAPPAGPAKETTKTETDASRKPADPAQADANALGLEAPPALEPAAAEDLEGKTAPPAGVHRAAADLLSFDEMMRPDAKPEVAPEPMLDQLQQAMNSALLDENAQLVMPQVVRGLATLVTEGVSEMRLQLMPEDLGEIELRVRTSEGVVRGEMMVQNPEVKHLLDQHLDRLRDALQQQGLDLRGFDIGLSPDGRFAQPDRSPHGAPSQNGTRRQAAGGASETAAPVLTPRGAKEVDYLA